MPTGGKIMASDLIAVDYWDQMITYKSKAIAQLYDAGKIVKKDVIEMSDLVLGTKKGRDNDEQLVNCSSLGLGALDTMIGYKLFLNAQKAGIGKIIKLWDKPLWE